MERIFDVEQQYPDTEFKKYIHVSKLGIDSRLYNSYEACPDTIRLIVNSLEVYPTDSVVDIGCGKGYAMYAMAQKPFSQIDGIEICPHLAETALHTYRQSLAKATEDFISIPKTLHCLTNGMTIHMHLCIILLRKFAWGW